ncbi:hypothetical protein HO173_000033 [Letharia columbiana]|uniref:Uncharacterized protein n=1 Tax=Letharia columbiana TaxID=112416 RepID=A0A8H6G647_9LECA|nr:uncharacterized protein HO173_000033 [Letharia columbiana]KAF6241323.1 hypothetical protein HO173_000033 [Letharia columbiana]
MASIGKATIADRVDACLCFFKRLLPSDNNVAGASDNQGMDRKRDSMSRRSHERSEFVGSASRCFHSGTSFD